MASYRNIYQFSIVSQNGDDVDIFILKKNYAGVVQQRPLGRAPILKRERNGNILGTSLEIFAECRVGGEFAQLYTSSADEFLVEVYRNQVLQWSGFVSPELYSEPDIAPPYDVQIIATDGLGELRETTFSRAGRTSLQTHLTEILSHTGLAMPVSLISSLQWDDQQIGHSAGSLLVETGVDLSHRIGDTCYDVLQDILASLNACITLQGGQWMVIRESDLYDNAEELNPALFGSMALTQWWPIGNMSTDIIPAKKRLTLIQENVYKENMLTPIKTGIVGGWDMSTGVYYDGLEDGFNVPPAGYVSNTIDFRLYPLSTQVALTIRARAIMPGARVERSVYMIYCEMQGRVAGVPGTYSLYPVSMAADSDRQEMKWHEGTEAPFFHSWPTPEEQIGEPVIEEFTFVVPLSADEGISADRITFRVQNVRNDGIPDYQICVYDMALAADRQIPGIKINADIANDAREAMADVGVILATSSDTSLSETMYGQLMGDEGIVKLYTPANSASDLLRFLVRDYAMQVALPRMRYRGKLNVPSMADPVIPIIFERDSTYYFLNTYSYDLLHDELEVELVSIPNASVTIESETVTELPSTGSVSGGGSGSSGGGGTSGGGGGGSSTLAGLSDVQVGDAQNGQALVYENGYWVPRTGSGGGALTSDAIISALGYTPFDSDAFTKSNIKNALGIADWALASTKPSYTWTEIRSRPTALSAFTNDLGLGSLAYKSSLVASDIPSLPWSKITSGKPTTLSGYGITDAIGYNANIDLASDYKAIGYGYADKGWKGAGPAMVFGTSGYNMRMQMTVRNSDYPKLYIAQSYNGVAKEWAEVMTYEDVATSDLNAGRYLSGGTFILHRSGVDTYVNYGNRATGRLYLYGSALSFNIGDAGAALILDSNKDASFAANLTVAGNMNSKNYPQGGVLSQNPSSAFISTIFGTDAVNDGTYRQKVMRAGNSAYDRICHAYAPMLTIKTSDTHAYISIAYNAGGKGQCYIGAGIGDAVNWSGILFHDNMNLIPKDDGAFYLGYSDKRWRTLNAVNVSADGIYGYVPEGGTYQRYRLVSSGDTMYLQVGAQDGTATTGKLTISGINVATLISLTIYSQQTLFSGAVQVNGTSRFVSLATFDKGLKIGDATLTWDASAGMLKIDKGVYIEGAITAKKKA